MNQYINRINHLHKNFINPILAPIGFKKKKWNYFKKENTHSYLIEMQTSKIPSETEYQFTFNLGVYIPNLVSIYTNLPEPKNPNISHSGCSARIGMLKLQKKDIWWRLNKENFEEDYKIAESILDSLRNFGLPFLNQFQSQKKIAEFLIEDNENYKYIFPQAKSIRFAYAGIIFYLINDLENSKQVLNKAINYSNKQPNEKIIHDLYKRLFK